MNHEKVLRAARAELDGRIAAGTVSPKRAKYERRRILLLKEQAERMRLGRERHAAAARFVNATLAAVRKARDEGRLVAIDAGWRAERDLEEVGITTREAGRTLTTTFRSTEWERSVEALHGAVEAVEPHRLPGIARKAYAEADMCAFHDAAGDLAKTGVDVASCPYADTHLLDMLIRNEGGCTLSDLHGRYVGGPCPHAHESGNDAARTMAVLLAMAELPPMRESGQALPGSVRWSYLKPRFAAKRAVWDKIEVAEATALSEFRSIPFMREGARASA